MSSTKTLPILFFTLLALNQHGSAAPTGINPPDTAPTVDANTIAPGSPFLDSTPTPTASPMLGYESGTSPSVTPFFTPAVFLENYYSDPKTAANFANDEADMGYEDQQDSGAYPTPEPAAYIQATSTMFNPIAFTTSIQQLEDGSPTTGSISPEVTSVSNGDSASQSSVEEVASLLTSASWSFPPLTSQLASASSHYAMATLDIPLQPTDESSVPSPATQMSRRAAIIGTVLAFASLAGITACVLCMRCRGSRKSRGISNETARPGDSSEDPGKSFMEKTSMTSSAQSSEVSLQLPILKTDAPHHPASSSQANGGGVPQHQLVWSAGPEFEDVTHVLSEASGAQRPTSPASIGSNRVSNAAPSVKAESYATCESRYSHPSTQGCVSTRASSTSDDEFLSMSPSSTPSPPESPEPCTPKAPEVSVGTRSRSKTVDQASSPRMGQRQKVLSSKSFPERLAGRLSGGAEEMIRDSTITEGSEWDIVAAYGRFSKRSTGVPSRYPSIEITPAEVPENMEAVDIGGKNCVLVQGYAF